MSVWARRPKMEVRKRGHCGGSWECLCASAASSHSVCNAGGRCRAFISISVPGYRGGGIFFTVPSETGVTHPRLYAALLLQAEPERPLMLQLGFSLWSIMCKHLHFIIITADVSCPPRLLPRFLLMMAVWLLSLNGPHVCRWGFSSSWIGN